MSALLKSAGRLNGNLRQLVKHWNSRECKVLKRGLVDTGTVFDGIQILQIYRQALKSIDRETALALAAKIWKQRALALKDGRLDLEAADNVEELWYNELEATI
jgi:hypothetical protein